MSDPRVDLRTYSSAILASAVYWKAKPTTLQAILAYPGIEPALDKCRALCEAVREGYKKLVTAFLSDPRVDPSIDNNVVLRTAIKVGRVDTLKLLLRNPRIVPSADNIAALRAVVDRDSFDTMMWLMADAQEDGSITNPPPAKRHHKEPEQ
jgi:hypothetical protein